MTIPAIYSSTSLSVAGDAAYNAQLDAYDGSAVKVEPSAGALAQGLLRPGRQLGAQNYNWLMGQFALIMTQLIADTAAQDVRLNADEAELADHETRIDTIEAWITNSSPRLRIYEYLASGTLVIPARVVVGLAYGCGGGGAGGGGAAGIVTVDRWRAGGAGGGGALASMQVIGGSNGYQGYPYQASASTPLIPGTTINIDVGAGGLAYTVTLAGTGGNGGDSKIRYGTRPLCIWNGAQGGRGSVGGHAYVNWAHFSMGGLPVRDTPIMLIGPAAQGIRFDTSTGGSLSIFGNTGYTSGQIHTLFIPLQPAQGGYGGGCQPALNVASAGAANPTGGWAGGAAGVKRADGTWLDDVPLGTNLTRRAGGPGGGGGAGPFGPGGNGGGGQIGNDTGSQSSILPTEGGDAGNNSGAGGGGGGSGGYENNVDDVGGHNSNLAGNGGSGRVYVLLVLESP